MKIYRLTLILWYGSIFVQISKGDGTSWRSGPPEGLPELNKLSVDCGKEEMTIYLEFTSPYDGSIYSKTNGQVPRCIHVAPHSRITEATFTIEYNSCGTRSDPQGRYYENTIIIQYDDVVIEAWDEAKKIRCEWHDGYEKSAYKMPITISDLDVVEMNFQGDDVDCWLEVQDGKGPWSAKVEGLVPLGSPLTLVVAIQDSEGQFDMRVKSCIAHDGHKHPIHLTDEDGCVLRPKMMSSFQKTSETKGTASVIAYSHFYAFKFPETVEVTIQCTVEICRHGCSDTCMQGRDAYSAVTEHVFNAPNLKEQEIPTYKDSHAFSTVIASKPNISNNNSLNSSKDSFSNQTIDSQDADPLKSSANSHNYFLNNYPYDLFDVLEAEDRQDKDFNDFLPNENEHVRYKENKDDIYYSQIPNTLRDVNEQGKNFPSTQIIHNILNHTTQSTDIYSSITPTPLLLTETNNEASTQKLPTAEKLLDEKDEVSDDKFSTDNVILSDPQTNILSHEIISPEESTAANISFAENTQSEVLHQLLDEEIINDESVSESTDVYESRSPETNFETFRDTNDYNEAIIESKEALTDYYEVESNRKINIDDSTNDKFQEDLPHFKTKARKPSESSETKRASHHFNYRPFVPPAPLPPLTLYNGLPLYYYGQPNTNIEFFDRHGMEYLDTYPQHKDYVKSKLRRPGRRRGRREIGEKEQLGLKQTLRVIATTDLDFIAGDVENTKPPFVEKSDDYPDVCIATSSFAAGLGLLLLANVCVLCVVVFLRYHYYIHRKVNVKNTELLCTEMS